MHFSAWSAVSQGGGERQKAFCFSQLKLSSNNSAPNSGNNHHLTIPFEGAMHSFKRQGARVKGRALAGRL